MKYVEVLNYKVFSDDLCFIHSKSEKTKVINTISPNSYGLATRNERFQDALINSDFLVLDGVYFAFASLLLKRKNIKANQGPDVFYHFMNRMNEEKGRVFFLGSMPQTLDKIEDRTARDYNNITVGSFSPPFKPEFSKEDSKEMIDRVNRFNPDVLFIGMTCPKQEIWAVTHREEVNAGLIICIGNVFDWFAGTQKPIHPFWFKIKLGWFIRIFLRPEIFKRNIGNQMKFFWHVILIFLKLKKI